METAGVCLISRMRSASSRDVVDVGNSAKRDVDRSDGASRTFTTPSCALPLFFLRRDLVRLSCDGETWLGPSSFAPRVVQGS